MNWMECLHLQKQKIKSCRRSFWRKTLYYIELKEEYILLLRLTHYYRII